MVLFLYGKDTFRSRDQMHRMIEKFKADRDPGGYNVTRIDAADERQPERIMERMFAAPFLAERRMVVIESLLSSKHTVLHTSIIRRIEEKTLPDANALLFWEGVESVKGKEASALFDRLAQEKYAQKFDLLSGAKLSGWIGAEASNRAARISSEAVQYIATHTQGDSWQASTLLDALAAYRNGDEIRVEDAQLFLDERADDTIFSLVDAIVAGRLREAYAMVEAQHRLGKDASYIFAMLIRQYRIFLELRDMSDRSDAPSSDQMARALSLHPFVVKKSLPFVRQYPMNELRHLYRELLEVDVKIKTGQEKPGMLLDAFIARRLAKK